jgi:hypothetical protein
MSVRRFTKADAVAYAKKYHLNLKVVPLEEFHAGINIEREHGEPRGGITDVVKGKRDLVVCIALRHLIEDPRYYYFLEKQEARREKYWSSRKKPSIFDA